MFLIPNLNIGGAEKYVVGLSNALIEHGHEVSICTISQGISLKKHLNEKVCHYELGTKSNLSIKKVTQLIRIIKEKDIQILHSHLFKSDLLNYFASFFNEKNIVRISTEHSTSSRRKKYKIFGLVQRKIYKRFNAVTAISDSVRNHIINWTGVNSKKVITIYNGTDMIIRPTAEIIQKVNEMDHSKSSIGTLARLETRKDLQTSLKAINYLVYQLKFTDFKYTIYGDGPEKGNLESLSTKLKIDKYVHFAGFSSDIGSLIDGFDLHILSSVEEGFGISIIETMARGIPNIGTDTGGIPEVISDNVNGFLFKCGDYEDLANKINFLLNEKKEMINFGISAINRVESDFTLESTVNKLLKVYEEEKDKRVIL